MQREMKFRAWFKPDGDTEDGFLKFEQKDIDGELMFVMEGDEDFKYDFQIPFLDDDWILEQFTGQKDKNGVEIYEGDIVKLDDFPLFSIEWRDYQWCIKDFTHGLPYEDDLQPFNFCIYDYCCVVGNIHQALNKND